MDEQPQDIIQPVVAKKTPTMLIVLISVIAAALIFGAAGYFGASYMLGSEKAPLTAQITTLTAANADLQTKLDAATNILADSTQALDLAKAPPLRVVYEAEGKFTAEEKTMLNEKVIATYVDYYGAEVGLNDPVQTIIIKKNAPNVYVFQAVHKEAFATFSFTAGDGKLASGAWFPTCMFTDCRDVPQKFAEKYPDLMALAKGLKPGTPVKPLEPTPPPVVPTN